MYGYLIVAGHEKQVIVSYMLWIPNKAPCLCQVLS